MMMRASVKPSDRELYYMYAIQSHNLLIYKAKNIDSNIYTLKSFMSNEVLDEFTRFMWNCLNCTHQIRCNLICSKCGHERFSYRMLIRRIHQQIIYNLRSDVCYNLRSDVCTNCLRKRVAEHLYQLPISKYYTRKHRLLSKPH